MYLSTNFFPINIIICFNRESAVFFSWSELLLGFHFVQFQVYLWYPLSIVTGGTTAKIMVAAKDNFLGKYIYKDTLARNLAAVIYRVMQLFFFSLFIGNLLHSFVYAYP